MGERRRLVLIIFLACLLGVFEVGPRTFLPLPYAYFFPAFGVLVLGVFRGWRAEALVFAFILGGLHDVFGFRQRFWFAGIPLMVLFLRFIALNVMTNRSVYSAVALVLLGRMFLFGWEVVAYLIVHSTGYPFLLTSWAEQWRVFVGDTVFVGSLFVLPVLFSRLARRFWQRGNAFTYGNRS